MGKGTAGIWRPSSPYSRKRGVYMSFLSNILTGVSLGSIYAIIALGYTMVYGIAKMLNFAHGDVIMVGAFMCFFATGRYGLPPLVSVLLAVVVCTALGIIIEGLAYKPLREAPSLAVLITAIGVSYLLQNVSLLAMACCLVVMVCLTFFTNRTRMGKAMRACSEDKGAAQLMGINVNSTISMTFAIGSALAAVAGVLMCSAYPVLSPTTGSLPGIRAFTAAVFGGIGSIPGAFLGGILLGIIETFAKAYISTDLSDAVVFAVLIIVLLVKPAGLLGKYVPEKV